MSLEHVTPADAVAIQPPPDPVERLYQELEAKVHEYRPKDDLAPLERAFYLDRSYLLRIRLNTHV